MADNILNVCKALERNSVQYKIVGGVAVALHGYSRQTTNSAGEITEKPDLDFWYNPTYNNYFKLLDALSDLGQDVSKFRDEQSPDPKRSFFRYEFANFTLDFLPELKAPLKFKSSFEKREIIKLDDTNIPFLNYDDLVVDKKANARSKDIGDLEQLQNKKKSEED